MATLSLAAGLPPFLSVFMEMYYVFASFWNYDKFYYVYGFSLLAFVMLLIVGACAAVVSTYLLLNAAEDWRWNWNAVASGTFLRLFVLHFVVGRLCCWSAGRHPTVYPRFCFSVAIFPSLSLSLIHRTFATFCV
jgi:hypothetical protein